jgi:hypothetical protein
MNKNSQPADNYPASENSTGSIKIGPNQISINTKTNNYENPFFFIYSVDYSFIM